MNLLAYDCGTMGNHEFNYGLDYLGKAMMQGANFPLVCANLLKTDGSPYLPPYKILERSLKDDAGAAVPVKIGVIGFVPPQIMQWDQGHLAGHVTTTDIVDAGEALRAGAAQGGRRAGGGAVPFRHRRRQARGRRGERGPVPGRGAGHRRDPDRPPAPGLPRPGLRRHRRRRRRARHAARHPGGDGRVLGQPSRHHRPGAGARRRRLEGRRLQIRGAGRSTSARTAR